MGKEWDNRGERDIRRELGAGCDSQCWGQVLGFRDIGKVEMGGIQQACRRHVGKEWEEKAESL